MAKKRAIKPDGRKLIIDYYDRYTKSIIAQERKERERLTGQVV
jgi:hypothetical protein